MDDVTRPVRGLASTAVRDVRCKDCLRERAQGVPDPEAPQTEEDEHFAYNEAWAQGLLERGGSRTDRCARHRRLHRQAIQGLAVAYIDLQTIGEVDDRDDPVGPLGGLGALPDLHRPVSTKVDLAPFEFGMTDDDIRLIHKKLADPRKRVLILKAGTGTGKSTFGPFRLLSPPDDVGFRLIDLGPIIVTEPRVQATTGVARFVGERLVMGCPLMECNVHGAFNPKGHLDDPAAPRGTSCPDVTTCTREHVGEHPGEEGKDCVVSDCARHIGPGYRVGYQVANDKNHDESCQLVYVTDGTMVNWLSEGRLHSVGTVIVDEAHERNSNIDYILAKLKQDLDRYPHLRVIVTSATFDVGFFVDYFGGPERAEQMIVPAAKAFGYGAPLFPATMDGNKLHCSCEPEPPEPGSVPVMPHDPITDYETWVNLHWPEEVVLEDGSLVKPREITRLLDEVRFDRVIQQSDWETSMGRAVAQQIIKLAKHLDAHDTAGDILAFLPNNKKIEEAVAQVERQVSSERADVFTLIQSAPTDHKKAALAARPPGAKRKIVIATNMAETSLTVKGVRFVIDSGLTTQEAWDPTLASKTVPTSPHSQAGLRQRWGRVGRNAPGWVFPLYTKPEFDTLAQDTPPGSTRGSLESVIMKAKLAGVDNIEKFPWPAAHSYAGLDQSAQDAATNFTAERERAEQALVTSGALQTSGRLTAFGKELGRFGQQSPAFAMAAMYADQLACVPEVVSGLLLLQDERLKNFELADMRRLGLFNHNWPGEWRLLADTAWDQLHVGCRDELDVVLRIVTLWEHADPQARPWEPSALRETWCAQWWLNHSALVKLAELRRTVLESLSPLMKEEVKRFLQPRLTPRARAVISRAFTGYQYERTDDGAYVSISKPGDEPATLNPYGRLRQAPIRLVALGRGLNRQTQQPELRSLIEVVEWATSDQLSSFDLLLGCREYCPPSGLVAADFDPWLPTLQAFPCGSHLRVELDESGQFIHQLYETRPGFAFPGEPKTVLTTVSSDEEEGETGWPTDNPHPGSDEEAEAAWALQEADDDSRDPSTGRTLGVESNDDVDGELDGVIVDVLAESRANAQRVLDVRSVAVSREAANEASGDGTWYTCRGYEWAEGRLALRLTPADPDRIGTDPAHHPDLRPGKYVPVTAGGSLIVRGRTLRILTRDEGSGQFLWGAAFSAPGNLVCALDSHHQEIVDELKEGQRLRFMVVPTVYGTTGLTLLPLLDRHLALAGAASQQILKGRPGRWLARVSSGPNDRGWATIELLHRDSSLPIVHRFGVSAANLEEETRTLLIEGQGLVVELKHQGPSLQGLRQKLEARAKLLTDDFVLPFFDADPTSPLCSVRTTQRRALSQAALSALLSVAPEDNDWVTKVWQCFLSSHAVQSKIAIEAGERTEPIELALPQPDTEANPQSYQGIRKGAEVAGVVEQVTPSAVWVTLPNGARALSAPPLWSAGADYQVGDAVRGRVHEVESAACRLILDLRGFYSTRAQIPPHWSTGLSDRGYRERLATSLGALSLRLQGSFLEGTFETAGGAAAGAEAIAHLLSSPAAQVEVFPDKIKHVIGAQRRKINELKSRPGIVSCDIDNATGRLTIIAKSSQDLSATIDVVTKLVRSYVDGVFVEPPIVDLWTNQQLDAWRSHTFEPADPRIAIAVTAPIGQE